MGAEVSVPDVAGSDRQGSAKMRDDVLSATGCEIVEMNVQVDHVHLLVKVPPRMSISELMGVLKGRTAIRLVHCVSEFAQEAVLGQSFLGQGYCVDTVGLEQRDDPKVREVPREGRTDQQQLQLEPAAGGPSRKGR